MSATVISVGDDPQLLSLRHAVLECAGFKVLTAVNSDVALKTIATARCGVLLLCYSMPVRDRQQIARHFREHCPDGRIIAITNEPQARPPVDADTFLYGLEGAEALIEAVRTQLESRPT